MANGIVTINGKKYEFDSASGKLVKEVVDDNAGKEDNKENNIEWTISEDGKLTVTGSCVGKLYTEVNYLDGVEKIYPWEEYRDQIKSVYMNVTGLTDMNSMFERCSNLSSVDISDLNTSNVTDMSFMFNGCYSLSSVDLSDFDTSSVTDMSNMFAWCSSLSSVDVSSFDTSNVTYMNSMFDGCSKLSSLDLSNFDTSNVTAMPHMFNCSENLTEIIVGSGWDTSNANTDGMFSGCGTDHVTIK